MANVSLELAEENSSLKSKLTHIQVASEIKLSNVGNIKRLKDSVKKLRDSEKQLLKTNRMLQSRLASKNGELKRLRSKLRYEVTGKCHQSVTTPRRHRWQLIEASDKYLAQMRHRWG